MAGPIDVFATAPTQSDIVRLAVAIALGLFLGLEREWSQKAAGIRTFALISVLGTIFTLYDTATCQAAPQGAAICLPIVTAVGTLFVIALSGMLMWSGFADEDEGLHLTTAVSMLVAYGVGVLTGVGLLLPATVVAVSSSLLLVFKRELHDLAWGLSREELRSATEFAILAFVIYPLLPAESVQIGPADAALTVEPRVIWLMVVFVSGIGIVNYAVVRMYGGRGIAFTGFFGGLASSTAVVGTMLDHVRQRPEARRFGVAAILLADAAMALRNMVIAIVFTFPENILFGTIGPLGAVILGSIVVAAVTADWSASISMDLETPFSLRNALAFGALFLLVVLAGGVAEIALGRIGFYATAAVTGLVSSAGATTSAVVLFRAGSLSAEAAVIAIMLATGASIIVKAALVFGSDDKQFVRGVLLWSGVLLVIATAASALVLSGAGTLPVAG